MLCKNLINITYILVIISFIDIIKFCKIFIQKTKKNALTGVYKKNKQYILCKML